MRNERGIRPIKSWPIRFACIILGAASFVHAQHHADRHQPSIPRDTSLGGNTASSAVPTDLHSLIRGGWVQIVRFEAPIGGTIEIASKGGAIALDVPAQVGLELGQPYRVRITNAPDKPGGTVYATMRLIGYILPPAHVDPLEYPIPIHFIERDFADVQSGHMVSNVVFLEDPLTALPIAYPPGEMPVLDVRTGEDVLARASSLGRPIVLIQIGNRIPLDNPWESAESDPPVHMVPAPAYQSGNDEASAVRQAGWSHLPRMGMSPHMSGHGGRSAPICNNCIPAVRLPYKVHPRMPFDECLPDGGDAIPYVHFNAYDQVTGLNPSETVAQFSRPGERPRVVPSNVVCLYAPRFGLARSSRTSIAGQHIDGPRLVDHRLRRAAMESRTSPELHSQRDRTQSVRLREFPSIVAMHEPLGALDELRVIAAMHKQDDYEHLAGRSGPSLLNQADELRIARSIEAAKAWSRDQFPAYTAISESGGQISGSMVTGEIQQIKQPHLRPGDLTLHKTVQPLNAKVGEIVEFAIYYHNVGQRPVENVSIIDSLTARLEYVPNSAKTDRRAVFTASPNEVESQELRWDISDPVPGGQGGVVWFQAKVR